MSATEDIRRYWSPTLACLARLAVLMPSLFGDQLLQLACRDGLCRPGRGLLATH
jgi:hypothetical protein